jgi:UDP-GlcNAc:undecaprenyl-phosphate/decaprenyl-phosphate GlcNAc-1-phosphate transferase
VVSLFLGFVIAFVATATLTPLVRRWAVQHGIVDAPGGRRVHARVTPRLGGIAIYAGFFLPLFLIVLAYPIVAQLLNERMGRVSGLVLGSSLVLIVGAIDDWRGIGPWRKLLAQTVAATIAFWFGFRIDGISLPWVGVVDLGLLAYPVTVGWFLGVTNSINLIDGLDGLAAGVALCACVSNIVVALLYELYAVAALSACLAGSLLGFLRHNFSPATVFMGDSGSMFVGFVLAATSLIGISVKGSTAIGLLAPMVALGIPIFDTMLAVIRRALRRQSIFSADRAHIHHRLLDMGLTHRRAVLLLYFGSVALSGAGIAITFGRDWQVGCALGFVFVTLFLMIRTSGLLVRRSGDESVLAVASAPDASSIEQTRVMDTRESARQETHIVGT